jgi:uncharacterized protein YecE (DUF72 family)
LLVQLPPSLELDRNTARAFFRSIHSGFDDAVLCEPRHPSWFTGYAERLLIEERFGHVRRIRPNLLAPGRPAVGWAGMRTDTAIRRDATGYYRWHGSPRMYWSRYEGDWLAARAAEIARWPESTDVWCVFDNMAAGAAADNALRLQDLLSQRFIHR